MTTQKPPQTTQVATRDAHPVATRDAHRSELVRVMGNSLYPGAKPESIEMALAYCEAAGLDPMQKPVHIVPLWNSQQGRMVDVIMPGIGLYRTNAARTGAFAGMGEPVFGPEREGTFTTKDGKPVSLGYPEWCRVSVKRRLPTGEIAEFTAVERWLENYATDSNKSSAPNAMWRKRAYGQLAKCAQAQALRVAFPEIGASPTAEEMEGKPMLEEGDIVDMPAIIEIPPELMAAANAAAKQGADAYAQWWHDITKAERQLLQFEHTRLKEAAQAADAARAQQQQAAESTAPPAAGAADGTLGFGDVAPHDPA